jgi:diamine N-acetyltransferase
VNQSNSVVTIREAALQDALLVSVLGATTFYEAYFEFDDPPDLANYIAESFAPAQIQSEFENPNSTFFVVYRNGKAVGYAKLRENSTVECVEAENAIELQRIYLVQAAWGADVGEKLLRHCLKTAKAKGCGALWLGVWEQNERAIRFYEKQGFERVGKITFPYGETVGVNLVMIKRL